ncbi:MAG: hypothetical protein JOZ39_01245 [Chloroflexi bacterium]|nr:hypothetical protein [Chloroflexota bacterium]
MRTLHIVNGESTVNTLRDARVGGDAYSWFDFLMEGPAPDGTAEGWEQRATELARRHGIDASSYLTAQREWQERLDGCAGYEEVVLWFEGDLFCVFNLAYLLSWFGSHEHGAGGLSLICPLDERLGTLQASRLAELFREREPVGPALLEAGGRAWQALVASEPRDASAFAAFPALERAVRVQSLRFQIAPKGTSPLEEYIMGFLPATGSVPLGSLWRGFCSSVLGTQLGMGDSQFVVLVSELHRRRLLHLDPAPGPPPYKEFAAWQVSR